MITWFLALQAAAMAPPADWSALPPLRLSNTPDYSALMTPFVHDEVTAGRCVVPAGKAALGIDVAVLVAPSGEAVRIVPRAIGCPTVEQFAAGLVQKAVRGNLAGAAPSADGWYRITMTISWGA